MGILSNIQVSFPDTIAIATTPKEVILHACPSATTDYDFFIVLEICITVLLSLIVIALTVGYSIKKRNDSKLNELEKRQDHEVKKLDMENLCKEKKEMYDSAWKVIEHSWKESKDCKANRQTDSNVDEAWKYIKHLWAPETPTKDSVNDKAGQPKS